KPVELGDVVDAIEAVAARTVRCGMAQAGPAPSVIIACGGGRRNPVLMRAIAERLIAPVEPAEAFGWRGDAVEAEAIAYLAVRCAAGLPITFPGTTGVAAPTPGGRIVTP